MRARRTKILPVDDSQFLRLATERALARAGYDVFMATDGELALELAREKKPDVILLDMLLPKGTGPRPVEGVEEGSGDCRERGGGVHRAVAEKRGSSVAGWSVRLSGKIGIGSGQRVRFVSGGAGGDREEAQPASSGARKMTERQAPGYYFRSA